LPFVNSNGSIALTLVSDRELFRNSECMKAKPFEMHRKQIPISHEFKQMALVVVYIKNGGVRKR